MILEGTCRISENPSPLRPAERPLPRPAAGEALVRVLTCGVCHTELDEIEGRTPPPEYPVIPGHQVVGIIEKTGPDCTLLEAGMRVGVGWIFSACGTCPHCLEGRENLCADFRATGRDADGGYAEFMVAPEASAIPIPPALSDGEAAPLLCAGAIGYRALRLSGIGNGEVLGLVGFGASGHLVFKTARHLFPAGEVCVFSRTETERAFALELGAAWAGSFDEMPPTMLHAAIDTTPAWNPVLAGLERLRPGGRLVINAIRKERADREALLGLDYPRHLWMEKEIKSVANITRRDIREFLALAAEAHIRPAVEEYSLEDANRALTELKERRIRGGKVLRITSPPGHRG
jgi:propanol-preferring alcohol dehydrogenase